jgi:hypothetical protein
VNSVWRSVETRVQNVRDDALRATAVPTSVRVAVFMVGTAALFLANHPSWWLPILALFPALFPRSMAATAFIVVTSLLWVTNTAADPGRLTTWRLCALAIALYLVHVGAALSAVLPYDAVYTAGIFRPWLVRAGAVGALTVAVGFMINVALPRLVSTGQLYIAATIGGIVLMVTTAIFIAYLGYRRQ